jgi:hypothetical protein
LLARLARHDVERAGLTLYFFDIKNCQPKGKLERRQRSRVPFFAYSFRSFLFLFFLYFLWSAGIFVLVT